MNVIRLIFGVLLALALASPVGAQTVSTPDIVTDASALIESGDYAGAIELLEAGSGSKSADASFELAYAYFLRGTVGRPVGDADNDDLDRAVLHANEARASGSLHASNLLHMIHEVEGSPHYDLDKAAGYLRAGADAGEASAMLNLAYELTYGSTAIPRDAGLACPYILRLRENERAEVPASHLLGLVLMHGGCGLQRDPQRAVELFRIAASGGITLAQRDLATALAQGIGVERNEDEALDWYEKAAANGDSKSLWSVGMAHVEGRFRPRDPAVAVDYFRRAVDAGSTDGMVSLAVMYATGDGVQQDLAKALELYEGAAGFGHAHAYRGLAVMYALGQGTDVDLVEARLRYRQAVALGDPEDPGLQAHLESAMSVEEVLESEKRFEQWRRSSQRAKVGGGD